MTDWVISSGDYMRPVRSPYGQALLGSGNESTVQSFPLGSLLEFDSQVSSSNFRLRQALNSNSTVTSTSLIGVAGQQASSITDNPTLFWPISRQTTFTARTRGNTLQSTNIGQFYGFFYDSTKNVYGVDLANQVSTSIRCVVTALVDAVGDSGGYVHFKFGVPRGSTNTFGGGADALA